MRLTGLGGVEVLHRLASQQVHDAEGGIQVPSRWRRRRGGERDVIPRGEKPDVCDLWVGKTAARQQGS